MVRSRPEHLPAHQLEQRIRIISMELERLYRIVLYLTFSPERAEQILRGVQWNKLRGSTQGQFLLQTQHLSVSFADALRYYPVDIRIANATIWQWQEVRNALLRTAPHLSLHLKPSGPTYTLPIYQSSYLFQWYLTLGGDMDVEATAHLPLEWIVSHYARHAMRRDDTLPSLATFNQLRGSLQSLIERYGLSGTIQRIENCKTPLSSVFDL